MHMHKHMRFDGIILGLDWHADDLLRTLVLIWMVLVAIWITALIVICAILVATRTTLVAIWAVLVSAIWIALEPLLLPRASKPGVAG